MKNIITSLIGLFGIFTGVGFILPALHKLRDFGAMPGEAVGLYTLGILLALVGISLAAIGLMRRKTA